MTAKSESLEKLKDAVELREKVKRRKPDFIRQESWRYIRVDENWRRPKGIDSKMRKEVKGWPAKVKIGYGGPNAARGLHPSTYREVVVYNVNDLSKINPEVEAARIAHTVGAKKRAEILRKAREKGIHILNPGVSMEKKGEKTGGA
ncbi:MAG: 50S ribosomal protein L32e [Candidatus Bathyarchaeota archaeon]|nr:50S ribosomal protein L32e [Candidatus Bathyarchaeota archaeon]